MNERPNPKYTQDEQIEILQDTVKLLESLVAKKTQKEIKNE